MGLFKDRPTHQNKNIVPVWFMRQAGRYHSHYQNIKKTSDFMTMCKDPKLACEVTMGPINDFKFDAAILFSDLLFPLEQLGMGLSYHSGPPTLEFKLETKEDLKKLKLSRDGREFYAFQGQAVTLLKEKLPRHVSMLGFVGAPFTLYTYAVEGSHAGNLTSSKLGFYDGRYQGFLEILIPELLKEMDVQAKAGAEAVCLFDTAAGEVMVTDYKEFVVPAIKKVVSEFKKSNPNTKVIYYSKLTHKNYLECLRGSGIDVLGVDWRHDIADVLIEFGNEFMIQGNIDPSFLHYPWELLEKKLNDLYKNVKEKKAPMNRWIMGLGHGVLQHTPEENVRRAVEYIHTHFEY